MGYREEIIRMLMDDIDKDGLGMVCGMTRAIHRNRDEIKNPENYVPSKLGRKMEAVKLLMEIDDSDKRFLNRVLVMLKRHNRKKGGAV